MPFLFFQEHFEKEKENSQFVSFLPSPPPPLFLLLFFPALVAAMQMESGTSCVMWVGWLDPILQKYLKKVEAKPRFLVFKGIKMVNMIRKKLVRSKVR